MAGGLRPPMRAPTGGRRRDHRADGVRDHPSRGPGRPTARRPGRHGLAGRPRRGVRARAALPVGAGAADGRPGRSVPAGLRVQLAPVPRRVRAGTRRSHGERRGRRGDEHRVGSAAWVRTALPERDEPTITASAAPVPAKPSPADLRRPVVAGVLGKGAEGLTLVLLATLVPRLLGPADYGRLSVVLTLVAVGSVALTLGGSTLLARYVPAALAEHRPALARALTLRLARNRIAPFALLAVVASVPAAAGRVPPATAALVLVALALNVAATLALQADLGLGRAAAWSARYPVQNTVL